MRPISAVLVAFIVASASCSALARPIRIVAFGDSATYGWLVARKDAYPVQLQALLRGKGYDVTVSNRGVPGDTTASALRRFDEAIAPGTDIALVELGTNDLRMHVPAAKMRANLAEIVRSLRARHIEVLLIGLGSLDLAGVAHATGVPYAQWKLPPGQYRARDGAHFNGAGYSILVARMLPHVEALIRRARMRRLQ
ncbi:MAG TPA: GDSL-type esterase/lipase family protein [Pseudolabrys sp.]|nr:GDSL-type esterase/lipase family protein [Pseudolabrys sp.]